MSLPGGGFPIPGSTSAVAVPGAFPALCVELRCADCVHWDSRDSLVGCCREITDHFLQDTALLVRGLAVCRTAASGQCSRFERSGQAREGMESERDHVRSLCAGAGDEYPASLW